ncbi:GH19469 [Drosophila grimshawi]|uniref:GH19469 n=1 Tax=Drosophila grimshawi TaxID=7222 RepID=B4JGK9_DROGR|nr:GH19469 [Drosophila grimshawi]
MFNLSRYMLGTSGAAVSLVAPVYNVEISWMAQHGVMISLCCGAPIYGIIFNKLMRESAIPGLNALAA